MTARGVRPVSHQSFSEADRSLPLNTAHAHSGPARRRRLTTKIACTLALVPAGAVVLLCFYAFVGWMFIISLTDSRLLPSYDFVGWEQYRRLLDSERWRQGMKNLALYAPCLIAGSLTLGYGLAVLIDRGLRWEKVPRAVFMLPLAVSFVVTGLIWQWILNPTLGIERVIQELGWSQFQFDWLVRSDRSIYTIALAGVWQQSGMCMALFLAAMRRVDANLWKVARVDGIPTWRFYLEVMTPMLGPATFTATVLLFALAAKSYDIVITLTGGGPGFSSDLPSRFIVDLLARDELGLSAAAACVLLVTIAAVVAPYLYMQRRP